MFSGQICTNPQDMLSNYEVLRDGLSPADAPLTPEGYRIFIDKVTRECGYWQIAILYNDNPIAVLGMVDNPSASGSLQQKRIKLSNIAVSSKYERNKMGSALIDFLHHHAITMGYRAADITNSLLAPTASKDKDSSFLYKFKGFSNAVNDLWRQDRRGDFKIPPSKEFPKDYSHKVFNNPYLLANLLYPLQKKISPDLTLNDYEQFLISYSLKFQGAFNHIILFKGNEPVAFVNVVSNALFNAAPANTVRLPCIMFSDSLAGELLMSLTNDFLTNNTIKVCDTSQPKNITKLIKDVLEQAPFSKDKTQSWTFDYSADKVPQPAAPKGFPTPETFFSGQRKYNLELRRISSEDDDITQESSHSLK